MFKDRPPTIEEMQDESKWIDIKEVAEEIERKVNESRSNNTRFTGSRV
jgi:hypothetical protein